MNSLVMTPHQKPITSINFIPSTTGSKPSYKVVTTSLDSTAKVWQCVDKGSIESTYWSARGQCTYRNIPITASAISHDASVLALAHDSSISLWDPESLTLSMVLPQPHAHIVSMSFMVSGAFPALVTLSDSSITVLNLLTATVWWTHVLGGKILPRLVPSHSENEVIVISEEDASDPLCSSSDPISRVSWYRMESPVPVAQTLFKQKVLDAVLMGPMDVNEGCQETLVLLNSRRELVSIPKLKVAHRSSTKKKDLTHAQPATSQSTPAVVSLDEIKPRGLLTNLYGSDILAGSSDSAFHSPSQKMERRGDDTLDPLTRSERVKRLAFLDTPSHLLPPPTKFAGLFFQAMLETRTAGRDESEELERRVRGLEAALDAQSELEKNEGADGYEGLEGRESMEGQMVFEEPTLDTPIGDFGFLREVFAGKVIFHTPFIFFF
jgi:hypothetical protein